MRLNVLTLAAATGFAVAAYAHAARADDDRQDDTPAATAPVQTLQGLLNDGYNTYISGNIGSAGSSYTSDSQGAIAAGGNVYLQNFGASTNTTAGGVGLAVGGSLTMTNGSVNGTTDVGGSLAAASTGFGNVNVGGSMSYLNGQINGNVNVNGSASITAAGVNGAVGVGGALSVVNAAQPNVQAASAYVAPINFAATSANVSAVSNYLAAQQTTAGDSFGKNAQGAYVFNSTVAGDNVFNLTQAQLTAMSGNQVLFNSTVAGATDIINVQGGGTVALPGNMSFGYTGAMTDNTVLLNLNSATTVSAASNVSYDLSILAPNATVVTTGGNITGSLFAANLVGNAQLNQSNAGGGFDGTLPGSSLLSATSSLAPAPAPLPLLGSIPLGLLVLAWFGRGRLRRLARSYARVAIRMGHGPALSNISVVMGERTTV